jgi:hypothetical protein
MSRLRLRLSPLLAGPGATAGLRAMATLCLRQLPSNTEAIAGAPAMVILRPSLLLPGPEATVAAQATALGTTDARAALTPGSPWQNTEVLR